MPWNFDINKSSLKFQTNDLNQFALGTWGFSSSESFKLPQTTSAAKTWWEKVGLGMYTKGTFKTEQL